MPELDLFRVVAVLFMLPSAFCIAVVLFHLVRIKLDHERDLELFENSNKEFDQLGILPDSNNR